MIPRSGLLRHALGAPLRASPPSISSGGTMPLARAFRLTRLAHHQRGNASVGTAASAVGGSSSAFANMIHRTADSVVKMGNKVETWHRLLCGAPKQAPKGFGNFFPKGAGKEGAKNGAKAGKGTAGGGKKGGDKSGDKSGGNKGAPTMEELFEGLKGAGGAGARSKSSGGGGGGGGAGGSGGAKDPKNVKPEMQQLVATGAVLAFLMYNMFGKSGETKGTEINWQEFKAQLLQSGQVDRLVVINKNIVRVVMRPDFYSSGANGGGGGGGGGGGVGVSQASGGAGGAEPGDGRFYQPEQHNLTTDSGDTYAEGRTPPVGVIGGQSRQGQAAGGVFSSSDGTSSSYPGPTVGQAPRSRVSPYFYYIGSLEGFERKLEIAQRELGIHTNDFVPVQYVSETNWGSEIMKLAPTILIIGFWVAMMRGMAGGGGGMGGAGGMKDIFKIGKSNAKLVNKDMDMKVKFKDVAGVDEAKREIMEFVSFLKDPTRFTKLGAKIPKGALLVGPPGTGKTMLAKATAGEASVPFFSISGSDFIEMFVGVGPSRVRDLFKQARENTPCIVFIDEIDAVARARGKGGFGGGNDERENTLNQLLVEMDGFSSSEGIVVLAGTNRADVLDKAILRPGRFDRQIMVDKPDIKGRVDIFKVYLQNLTLDPSTIEDANAIQAQGKKRNGTDSESKADTDTAAATDTDTATDAYADVEAEAQVASAEAQQGDVKAAANTDEASARATGAGAAAGATHGASGTTEEESHEEVDEEEDDDEEGDEEEEEVERDPALLATEKFFAQRLAALTPGFAGAEIANICNEAAILAAREAKDHVQMVDFEKATDRVIGGLEKKNSVMTLQEKRTIAYHEAGHAIVGWFMEYADPLLKVTIVPRSSGALGFAQYLPKEVALYSKERLQDTMCMALGGRASEELTFGQVTTGASDDLNRVTKIAYGMVTLYGMSDKVGQLAFPPNPNETEFIKPYSDATAELMDQEAKDIVAAAYERTKKLLAERKDEVAALAELLLEKETINQDDIIGVLGERPFESHTDYDDLVSASWQGQRDAAEAAAKESSSTEGATAQA